MQTSLARRKGTNGRRLVFGDILWFENQRVLTSILALHTLARLHSNGDTTDQFVLSQIADMKADIYKSRDIGESRSAVSVGFWSYSYFIAISWKEIFAVPSNFRRVSLGYILQFSVQMTGECPIPSIALPNTTELFLKGVSAIQYYSTTVRGIWIY